MKNNERRILLASSMTIMIMMLGASPALSQMTFAQTPGENITPFAAPDHAFSMGVGCDSFKLNASITEVRENCELSFRNVDLLGDTFEVTGVLSVSEDVAFDFDNGTMAITTATNVSGVTTCEVGGSFPCDLGELDRIIVTENSHTTSSAGTTSDEFSFFFVDLCDGIFDDSCPTGETNEGSISANTLVRKAMPDITTMSNVTGTASIPFDVKDTATLSDGFFPTGTINFTLYKNPSGTPDCTDASQKVHSELVAVAGNGDYMSSPFSVNMAGNYSWLATYSGDGNNTDVTLPPNDDGMEEMCNEDGETFEANELGMLKIVKNTIGGDATFDFESNVPGLGDFDITTVAGMGMSDKVNITAGIYNATELVPENWTLTSNTCDDGSPTDAIDVSAGEFVTCTFENTADGMLKIVKETIGGNDGFSFESDVPGLDNFVIITLDGMGMTTKQNVTGIFNVTEIVPDDWQLTSNTCDDGSPTDAINVSAGEFVTCTFENTADGMLKIVKNTIGGDDTFSYESDVPGLDNFDITTVAGMGMTMKLNVDAGIFNVTEVVPDKWNLLNATCNDGSPTDAINVSEGESVTCTFWNEKKGGFLKIVKAKADPEDPDGGPFDFLSTLDAPWDDFNLNTGEMTPVIAVPLDTAIIVSEVSTPPMWALDSSECDNGDSVDNIIVTVPESTVTCTFFNDFMADPGLWIIKEVKGSLPDGQYNFTIDGEEFSIDTVAGTGMFHIDPIEPGTYEVIELNDEDLVSATCSNGDNPSAVTLEKDDMVTCTFINRGDIIAGELLPIDNTALFLAGLNASMIWIVPTLAAIAGTGIYVAKTRLNKD